MTKKMRIEKGLLKTGEIAVRAEILPSTIRYYTDIGLIKVVQFTKGGYRLYDMEDTISRLNVVKTINMNKVKLSDIKKNLIT